MGTGLRCARLVSLVAVAAALTAARGQADVIDVFAPGNVPFEGTFLTSWGPSGLGFVSDGTSHAISLGETSSLTLCFDGVGVAGASGPSTLNPIADGSSNTIQFTESSGFRVSGGRIVGRRPISQVADGTSNTIVIGEIPADTFCLSGVQATPPSQIADGTSNTILIGESSTFDVCVGNGGGRMCVENVRVPGSASTSVPEPTSATLLALGMAIAAGVARRRRNRGHPAANEGTGEGGVGRR